MQIHESIITILDELCVKFGMAIDWTTENIFPYLQELCRRYITYEIAISSVKIVMPFVIAVILLVAGLIISSKARKLDWDFEYYLTPWVALIIWGICLAATIIFFCIAYEEAFHIIECLTIPEKVVLDYLSSVLNG